MYKFYTLDNQFIEEIYEHPVNFTGIAIYAGGTKAWYVEGKLHRLDGPAYISYLGRKEWWVDEKQVTEKQCKILYSIMKLKGLL